MMKLRFAAAFCLAASAFAADELRATHDALFASYVPLEDFRGTPEMAHAFEAVRDAIWQSAGQAPAFRSLIAPFTDLAAFAAPCGVSGFVKLPPAARLHALYLMHTCASSDARRLAMSARAFYLRQTYGPLQEKLTGVKLNLFASDAYAAQHRPELPPARLRYDAAKHEIERRDGPIDYLIVGSGPAGSVLAHELRRGGKRVVLLERGSFIVPGAMETRLVDELKESNGTRTSADGAIFIRNGMAVGGGSLVNVDLCFSPTLPSIQFKIDGWRREGRIGKSDFTLPELTRAYEWVKTAIGTRVLDENEINANNRVLWEGALKAGLHPKLYDLNTYPPGRSPYPVTDKRSSEELVIRALEDKQNPLSLQPDADVRRVLFDGREGSLRARGVELVMRAPFARAGVIPDPNGLHIPAGETVTMRARTVILSAGALGSPAILLRSKVPNPEIGRGAVLHCSMPLMGLFDRNIDALQGTQASVFVDDFLISQGYALEAMSAEPLYAALMSPGPARHSFDMLMSYRKLAGFGVMLIDTPSPENRVILDDAGEPRVEYTISEADKVRFRRGVAVAARVMFKAGAKRVYLPTTEDILNEGENKELRPAILTDIGQTGNIESRLKLIPNRTMLSSAHLQATNKMGSVVSRDFRVKGTDGLYVVDGSIFPTSVGANPMQSIYTFAKIFADRLLKEQP